MIPIQGETLIQLRDVPRHLPAKPNAKRVHISACYRWVSTGVRGIVLESLKVGGTTYTSIEALERFSRELSRRPNSDVLESRGGPSTRASQREANVCPRIGDPATRAQRSAAARLELELALPVGRLSRRGSTQEHGRQEHSKEHP